MRVVLVVLAVLAACGGGRAATTDGPGSGSSGGSDAPGGGSNNVGQVAIYAHDANTLYRVDPDTYAATKVGMFDFTGFAEEMTDLGIDQNGNLVGASFTPQFPTGNLTTIYMVDATTAHCAKLTTSGSRTFNGLSFIPAAALGGTGADVLVGTEVSDGLVWKIDQTTGALTQVGNMGGSFVSSGDIVSVEGFGTVQTVKGATHDVLVRLAPGTFTATPIGTNTGFDMIWGIGFWKGKVFGFTNAGQIITIDPNTGAGTQVASNGPAWYGAAVTTVAPLF